MTRRPSRHGDAATVNVAHPRAERHALGDLLQSVGVVVSGGLIWWKSDGHDGNTVLYPAVDHGYGESVSDPFRKRDRKLW